MSNFKAEESEVSVALEPLRSAPEGRRVGNDSPKAVEQILLSESEGLSGPLETGMRFTLAGVTAESRAISSLACLAQCPCL